MEYPGYGPYKGSARADRIERDSQIVYDFLMEKGVQQNNILVMGRSIGTGPATYLASRNKIGVLILMSAYTSIKRAAAD